MFRLLLITLMGLLASISQAGDILDGIKARGELRCGVSEGIASFSEQHKSGRWIVITKKWSHRVHPACRLRCGSEGGRRILPMRGRLLPGSISGTTTSFTSCSSLEPVLDPVSSSGASQETSSGMALSA